MMQGVALEMILHRLPEHVRLSPSFLQRATTSALALGEFLAHVPDVVVIAGSGIAASFARYSTDMSMELSSLFDLPTPTVSGHGSMVSVMSVEGVSVLLVGGRHHLYEGHSAEDICLVTLTCHLLGCRRILYTNAVGALSPSLSVGDLVLCTDAIDGTNAMQPYDASYRHSSIIHDEWRKSIERACLDNAVEFRSGTYVMVVGPSYETRAEIRMYRRMGADVIGMSTVMEARLASLLGMQVSIVSLVTNTLTDVHAPTLSHNDVLNVGATRMMHVQSIVKSAILCE